MKQEHCNGLLWAEQNDAVVNVGLTPEFFKQSGHIWHIMPPRNKRIMANGPLLSIITYDDMSSLRSPHAGKMTSFNRKASITPDKLSPDEVVLTLNTADLSEEEEVQAYVPRLGDPIARRNGYNTPQFRGILDSLGAQEVNIPAPAQWVSPFATLLVTGSGHIEGGTPFPEQGQLSPEVDHYERIRSLLTDSLQVVPRESIPAAVTQSISRLSNLRERSRRQQDRLEALMVWRNQHERGEF